MNRDTRFMRENARANRKGRFNIFYGWYVIAAGALLMASCFGVIYSFSVYFVTLQNEFSWNRSAVSGAFSLYLLLVGFFSTICGRCVDRFGPKPVVLTMGIISGFSLVMTSRIQALWQLYITYSVLLAAGMGGIYIIAMSMASRWFYRKRATAMGVLGAAGSLGTVVMAPVSAWMIVVYQWRAAYLITGVLTWCLMIPAALALKASPAEIGSGLDGDPRSTNMSGLGDQKTIDFSVLKAIKSSSFGYLSLLWFWFSFCLYMVITHIVPKARDLGLDPVQAAGVMSILTAVSAVMRLAGGMMADRMDKRKLLSILTTVMAMSMVWMSAADRSWMLYPFAVVFGLTFGGGDTSVIAVVTDVFGIEKVGTMMGILMISWGMGSASGPYLAGWVFDLTGSYYWAFLIAASGLLSAAFFCMRLKPENQI